MFGSFVLFVCLDLLKFKKRLHNKYNFEIDSKCGYNSYLNGFGFFGYNGKANEYVFNNHAPSFRGQFKTMIGNQFYYINQKVHSGDYPRGSQWFAGARGTMGLPYQYYTNCNTILNNPLPKKLPEKK